MAQDEDRKEQGVQADTAELTEAELEKLAGGASSGVSRTATANNLKQIGLGFHNY
jgi:hypothetical protein